MADTIKPLPAPVRPPRFAPLDGTWTSLRFSALQGYPHTSLSDHLRETPQFDAVGATEYATERQFTSRGVNPLAVQVRLDGIPLDLRRLTFPQTMAPDLMATPPYLFSGITIADALMLDSPSEVIELHPTDSLAPLPYSDFFVRRGDYGLSLTQGRLFRPLPGRRTVNLGFSFAQSDGRGVYNRGDNRYLHGQLITPLRRGYNVLLDLYQYRADSDVQTAQEWWRYNFRRDDLAWHVGALFFRGDSVSSPLVVRAAVRHNKQDLRSQPQALHALLKSSRAELSAVFAPVPSDSRSAWRAGAVLALDQFHVRSAHYRRPEYAFWGEHRWQRGKQIVDASARLDGNDDDPPAPEAGVSWRLAGGGPWHPAASLYRTRVVPSQIDRHWPRHMATLENLEDRQVIYWEEGNPALAPWWSNRAEVQLAYEVSERCRLRTQAWGSYEQDYYGWGNTSDSDSLLWYQPVATDARTAGFAVQVQLPAVTLFTPRLAYVYTRAQTVTGARLPEYRDHRLSGIVDAQLAVPRFNLRLQGSAEFMYWRAPSRAHTAYDRRDVWRTDVLGSATIKDFTIYWMAQNLFNYGYRKAPGFADTGRTIMWGLHLRFYN